MKTMLEQERMRLRLSRAQVAQAMGVSVEMVRLLETGQRKPSYDVLVKLMNLFECNDPRQLFEAAPDSSQCQGTPW